MLMLYLKIKKNDLKKHISINLGAKYCIYNISQKLIQQGIFKEGNEENSSPTICWAVNFLHIGYSCSTSLLLYP